MTTSSEVNENTRARRQTAAEESSNVVDLSAQRKKDDDLDKWIREASARWDALQAERKVINDNVSALLDEGESRGLTKPMMKKKFKERAMDEAKREAEEATARRMNRAFGWDYEQLELLPIQAPQQTSADLSADNAAAIGDHLSKHGSTAQH